MNDIMKRIEFLRMDNNLKAVDITDYLGVSKSAYTNWRSKDRTPDAPLIPKIAELFGVTSEYILTGKELGMSDDERKLIGLYNGMNKEGQRLLMEYAEFIRARYIKTDKSGVVAV